MATLNPEINQSKNKLLLEGEQGMAQQGVGWKPDSAKLNVNDSTTLYCYEKAVWVLVMGVWITKCLYIFKVVLWELFMETLIKVLFLLPND